MYTSNIYEFSKYWKNVLRSFIISVEAEYNMSDIHCFCVFLFIYEKVEASVTAAGKKMEKKCTKKKKKT